MRVDYFIDLFRVYDIETNVDFYFVRWRTKRTTVPHYGLVTLKKEEEERNKTKIRCDKVKENRYGSHKNFFFVLVCIDAEIFLLFPPPLFFLPVLFLFKECDNDG